MIRLLPLFPISALFATPARADLEGFDHMMGWGYGFGMFFGPVLWLLVLGLVVAGVIWLVRRPDDERHPEKSSSALAELDMRLARGEIEAEDYSARKKLLSS